MFSLQSSMSEHWIECWPESLLISIVWKSFLFFSFSFCSKWKSWVLFLETHDGEQGWHEANTLEDYCPLWLSSALLYLSLKFLLSSLFTALFLFPFNKTYKALVSWINHLVNCFPNDSPRYASHLKFSFNMYVVQTNSLPIPSVHTISSY